jgi:SagB-type dehydrogenase family enzyme
VLDFHESTKLTPQRVHAEPIGEGPEKRPFEFHVFEMAPSVPLPVAMIDVTAGTLGVMDKGLAALPIERIGPPQDLKTLATWLHFADGIASKRRTVTQMLFQRTCFSDGGVFPCELYVAAFAVEGLEPGLYHYSPRDFGLRKLRTGQETLARLTRGRPDLAMLKTVPAAMLVSTVFSRSTWRFGKRGYRHALHDAGYLLQNLVTVSNALGIQTITRMQLNDMATRELIGVGADSDFAAAEAVQGMIIWADRAVAPMDTRAKPAASAAGPSDAPGAEAPGLANAGAAPVAKMPLIERAQSVGEVTPYVSILAAHVDCVAPGVAVREVRPPLTEMSPLSANSPTTEMPAPTEPVAGEPIRKVLLTRQASSHFAPRSIDVQELLTINRLAFRGGTFFPLHPEGQHVALVRPMWVVHDVTGMEAGVWGYSPTNDKWTQLRHGDFRTEAAHLAVDQGAFGNGAASCFLCVNLHTLMYTAGPDLYRLAHLESGIASNRIALSSEALNLGWFESGLVFEEEARHFLGLQHSTWEVLNVVAVGARGSE